MNVTYIVIFVILFGWKYVTGSARVTGSKNIIRHLTIPVSERVFGVISRVSRLYLQVVYEWYLDVSGEHRRVLALMGYPYLRDATKVSDKPNAFLKLTSLHSCMVFGTGGE